ncbi:LINE-1 reverse transcriptase like, partial [Glycine soja]
FLLYMLRRMGFCDRWLSWIEGCLKSASISILVNGSSSSEFIPQRGLRQGDPLAPLLFNVVMEGLNGLLREAMEKNLFQGLLVGRNEMEVSILQYADDTIFFGKTSMENFKAIKVILRSFELVSGLKINFSKSNFVAI